MSRVFQVKLLELIAVVSLVTILFLPSFKIFPSFPSIEIVDLIFPIAGVLVFLRRGEIYPRFFFVLILIFAAYIFTTILINSRIGILRDYYEIFKVFKFGLLTALFSMTSPETFTKSFFKKTFLILLIFNLTHYFNLFNINFYLSQILPNGERYLIFGLDSLGELTGKRMLGLSSNPNNNAIIFLVFSIFFIPQNGKKNITEYIWFFSSLFMVFLCQSRTAMLMVVAILISITFIHRKELKFVAMAFGSVIFSFGFAFFTTKYTTNIVSAPNYLQYVGDQNSINKSLYEHDDIYNSIVMEGENSIVMEGENSIVMEDKQITYLETVINGDLSFGLSVSGRFEVWEKMWKMIKEKPIFGYGPNKDFFYKNEIYSENEYILITWRYGFIGLFIYISIYLSLLWLSYKNIFLGSAKILFLVVLIMIGTATTNNPFAHQKVLVLFALVVGLLFKDLRYNLISDDKINE